LRYSAISSDFLFRISVAAGTVKSRNRREQPMGKNTRHIKIGTLIMTVIVICSGCQHKPEVQTEEKFTISFLEEYFGTQETTVGTAWCDALEELTGAKVDITNVYTLSYVDKVNSLLAKNGLPMVITANNSVLKSASLISTRKAGGFWELDEYLADFPNLYEFMGSDTWDRNRIDGKIYGIPRLRILARNSGYYREDWAKALGMSPPGDLEELYDMLYAFTYNDPDGNGIDDTYGLVNCWASWGNRGWNGIQTLTTILGGPNGWEYSGGVMTPDFGTDEYVEALNFFKRLYDDKIMNPDFIAINPQQRQELFEQGKVGMIFGVIDDIVGIQANIAENGGEARLTILPALTAQKEGSIRVNSTSGSNGLIMFNRFGENGIKTEEELRRVLAFYDTLCTQEGQDLIIYGVLGVHYEVRTDGEQIMLYEKGKSIRDQDINSFGQSLPVSAYYQRSDDTSLQKAVYTEITEREKYLVFDDSAMLYSDTYNQLYDQLDRIIMEASLKYIVGEIGIEEYWEAYNEWLSVGGQKVIEEYTSGYRSLQ